jgi:L-aspartate oxidase
MEFVQFHPTALDVGLDPMPLVSEAVRGEGAILINDLGERFLADAMGAELAPRDVVARAVWRQIMAGRTVFLDPRRALGAEFATAFPQVAAACKAAGIDPASAPIPIRPAAHYHMGGVRVDHRGRTDVEGLWACGEVASTGLHGANRLASNSLLEAIVCGMEVADDLHNVDAQTLRLDRCNVIIPPAASAQPVRPLLDRYAGVLREQGGLEETIGRLHRLANQGGPASDPALTAIFIAHGALKRQESRGGHYRSDFPARSAVAETSVQSLADLRSVLDLADAA